MRRSSTSASVRAAAPSTRRASSTGSARAESRSRSGAPGGAGPGGRREQRLAGPRVQVPEGGRTLGHGAGEDDETFRSPGGRGRHQGRQLGEGATLVGPGRITGAGEDAVRAAVEEHPGHGQRVGGLGAGGRRSASRSGPRRSTSGASARSEAATTASRRAGVEVTVTSGSRSGRSGSTRRWAARSGSASATRARRRCAAASGCDRAGRATEPSSRQAWSMRPIRAAPVVAAPRSMARNARGSLVIGPCYPARRRAVVTRPRSPRRRTPRAGR